MPAVEKQHVDAHTGDGQASEDGEYERERLRSPCEPERQRKTEEDVTQTRKPVPSETFRNACVEARKEVENTRNTERGYLNGEQRAVE